MESSLLASSLRMTVVLNVRMGATVVAARKFVPAQAAVLKVERAKRDILSFLANPPNQKLTPARAAVLRAERAKKDIPSFAANPLNQRITPARAAASMMVRAKRDILSFLMNPLNQKSGMQLSGISS